MNVQHILSSRLCHSDIARRMANGAFWSFTGTALGKFFLLLTGIVCARILGKEMFGQLGMVRSTIGMFIILGTGGIGVTATRYISAYRASEQQHAASIYRMSAVFAVLLAVATTLILLVFTAFWAEDVLTSDRLLLPLAIGSGALFLSIVNSTESGALAGLEDFRSIAVNTLASSFVEAVAMIVGAWLWQVEGAIGGFALGILVLWLLNRRSARNSMRRNGIPVGNTKIWKSDWQLLYRYSIPATLSAMTVTPVFWLVRSMLVRSDGYSELGDFEAADQWKVIILFVPGAISQIILPILSSIRDSRLFRSTMLWNLLLMGASAALLAAVTWLLAPVIMPLYGKTFTDLTPLGYLALSTIPTALAQTLEMTLYSKEKMWTSLMFNLLWGVAAVAISHVLLSDGQGAAGIAMAVLLAYVVKLVGMGAICLY